MFNKLLNSISFGGIYLLVKLCQTLNLTNS